MNDEKLKQDTVQLVEQLNKYSDAYYNGTPLVSDEEYDRLYDRLLVLERIVGCICDNSPTLSVGAIVKSAKKLQLEYPCLSLQKTKNEKEFINFCGEHPALFSVKLDGLTTQLTYEDGLLVKAVTRGNGSEGTDVTRHLFNYINVPLQISYKGKLVVTGESIITQDTLDEINSKLEEGAKFATCRNLASGTLNQLDPTLCKERNMKFYVFNVNYYEGMKPYLYANLKLVEQLGFTVAPCTFNDSEDKVVTTYLKNIAEYNHLPYDGVVVVYNDIEYGKSLGSTGHHPRSGLAYKFEDEEFETVFRNITYDVTRNQKISMVANFDPVVIDATIVSRALIPNYDMFKELQLGEGDIILVRKANMIIPQIVDNIIRSNTYQLETTCPCCGEQLELKAIKNTQDYYCINPECRGSFISQLVHMCSNEGLNIKGVSEATLETLVNKGYIRSLADVFRLYQFEVPIVHLEGFGKTSFNNLMQAIENSRTTNLSNYIYSLGIRGVGKKVSKQIEEYRQGLSKVYLNQFGNETYIEWLEYELMQHNMTFITPSIESNLLNWIDDPKNFSTAINLEAVLNIVVPQVQQVNNDTVFSGKKVCVTGTLVSFTRNSIKEKLTEFGAESVDSVSSKTDYLICGEKAGSKLSKAEKLGVKVLTEQEFLDMIN